MANMTYQDSHQTLVREVYAPVFFNKLAQDWGIAPQSEKEALDLLALSGELEQLEQISNSKTANTQAEFISSARQRLGGLLKSAGIDSVSTGYSDAEIKEAAHTVAQNPQIRDAALLFQDAMAQLATK